MTSEFEGQVRTVQTARHDGFAPIESYAALGDGRTVALVACDGRIDWFPVPTIDSPPAFAAILDPDIGGFFALTPDQPFTVRRRYVEHTNVLESVYTTESGEVRVVDALAVGRSGRLPWTELIRQIEGLSGSVPLHWEVAPGTRFQSAVAWTEVVRGEILLHLGDQHFAIRAFDVGEPTVETHRVLGSFTTSPGSRHLLALTGSDAAPVFLSHRAGIEARLTLTIDRWREWTGSIAYEGKWADAVQRSAIALKLLQYATTGAIAAAPTTSLPERIEGDRNWDYRYMWVRDAAFTADALMAIELYEEAQAAVCWLLGTVRRTYPDVHVFYKLDGAVCNDEQETLPVRGYRDSVPVRAGNNAARQTQHGVLGDLFGTVAAYVDAGHRLDSGTATMLAELADRVCNVWLTPDAGIWELKEERHYTASKIACWTALQHACHLADLGELPSRHANRWAAARDDIKQWVDENCWSKRKKSYTFYAGSDGLDAAVLLGARAGFDTSERFESTIDAIRHELCRGPLVYRYSGMDDAEGCFVACTFWLVSALTAIGRLDDARALMTEGVALCSELGLLAEEMDPKTGAMLGNFPQGLSHLALINAAVDLTKAENDAGR